MPPTLTSTILGRLIPAGLVIISAVVALLLAELVLRAVVNPSDFLHATLVEDPVLGLRIQPLASGHDALGFRNAEVPARADIVAIGDSMTYGVSAPREGSWPHQLAMNLDERVYNMGLGGYGPLQYLHLAQTTARTLQPRLLVVGFYFGNDLMDAYYLARSKPHWYRWRESVAVSNGETEFDRAGSAEPRKRFQGLRDWLSRHSVFYSVLRATVFNRLSSAEQEEMTQQASPEVRMAWKDAANPAVRTVFTARYRLAATDLRLPEVREGMQITKKAFAALDAESNQQGIRLMIVLIPTKERAYCGYLEKSGDSLPEAFSRLCRAEAQATAELVRFLSEQNIAYIHVTAALESQIERHVQLYPVDADGHPQSAGYGVIAAEIAAAIHRNFPRP